MKVIVKEAHNRTLRRSASGTAGGNLCIFHRRYSQPAVGEEVEVVILAPLYHRDGQGHLYGYVVRPVEDLDVRAKINDFPDSGRQVTIGFTEDGIALMVSPGNLAVHKPQAGHVWVRAVQESNVYRLVGFDCFHAIGATSSKGAGYVSETQEG